MKKIITIILSSILFLVSCTNDLFVSSYYGEIELTNASCALTKGVSVYTDNLSNNYTNYTLYAYAGDDCYISNAYYTLQDLTFTSGNKYYWPNTALKFWIYPTSQDFIDLSQTSDSISFSYDHPSDVNKTDASDSKDAIFAYTYQTPGNLVDVTFKHALASIKVIYNTAQIAHHITNITISGINTSGDCVFDKNNTFTWSNTTSGTYSQDMDVYVTKDDVDLTDNEMTFFVVPGKGFTIDVTLDNGNHAKKEFLDEELTPGVCSKILINDEMNIEPSSDAPTNKTVNKNSDGTYNITIEAYVTGKKVKKTVITEKPIDFILVMDVSGSMAYDMDGNNTNTNSDKRITILKNAVSAFADTIAVHAAKYNVEHRVAVVKFAGNASDNVGNNTYGYDGYNYSQLVNHFTTDMNTIKSNVNSFTAAGGTRISSGMYYAKQEFNNSRADAEKVCIVFTDGGPGDHGWDDWSDWSTGSAGDTKYEAQNAVKYAYDMKSSGVKIYAVGVFTDDDADSNEFMNRISSNYLDATTFTKGTSTTTYTYDAISCNAQTAYNNGYYALYNGNYYKVQSRHAGWQQQTTTYYISPSNNPGNKGKPQEIDVTSVTTFYIRTPHTTTSGYTNGTKTSSDYYTNTTSASALINTFSQIASESAAGGASVELNEESYAYDIISDIFELPTNYGQNSGDISFYSVEQTGYNISTKEISWSSTQIDITNKLTWSFIDHTLKVSGWDYSGNCCGEGCEGTGHKLILKIDNLEVKDDVTGKHYTNQYGSGLYDSEGNLIVEFNSPSITL